MSIEIHQNHILSESNDYWVVFYCIGGIPYSNIQIQQNPILLESNDAVIIQSPICDKGGFAMKKICVDILYRFANDRKPFV